MLSGHLYWNVFHYRVNASNRFLWSSQRQFLPILFSLFLVFHPGERLIPGLMLTVAGPNEGAAAEQWTFTASYSDTPRVARSSGVTRDMRIKIRLFSTKQSNITEFQKVANFPSLNGFRPDQWRSTFFLLAPVTTDLSGNDSVTTGEEMYQNLLGVVEGIGHWSPPSSPPRINGLDLCCSEHGPWMGHKLFRVYGQMSVEIEQTLLWHPRACTSLIPVIHFHVILQKHQFAKESQI